jgi:hypothetical protein
MERPDAIGLTAVPLAMTHTIHLRSAWETTSDLTRTRHSRKFGRPRTLDAAERVWLICRAVPGPAEVSLNGEQVGSMPQAGPFAADITEKLRARNIVELRVESAELLGDVVLEIRSGPN